MCVGNHRCMSVQGYSLPILPMVLPPAIQALMHSPPAGTPEQQVHQAAAAAAAAAAVMSSPYSPYSTYSTMMLPPSIIPLGALLCLESWREWSPGVNCHAAST